MNRTSEKSSSPDIRLSWERKPLPDLAKVERELSFSKVARKPRLNRTVETVDFSLHSRRSFFVPLPGTFDKVRKECPGQDAQALEGNWRRWAEKKEARHNAMPPSSPLLRNTQWETC
jgi:hypothetical protein